jgi:hypothetical protein
VKEKFTPEEWHLLKLLPFLAFSFVAGSLREVKRLKLDGSALAVFQTWLAYPTSYGDALHREVAQDTPQSEWDALLSESRDPTKIEASVVEGAPPPEGDETLAIISRLLVIRGILAAKLIVEQYESFVTSVLTISADAPFRDVPRKGRERADEAISTLAGMLLQDPSTASATVSVSGS